MNFRPSDLFLNVIDFFGILIPGVVFIFFHGDFLMHLLGVDIYFTDHSNYWILVFCFSFISGHFLMGLSVWMNKISIRCLASTTKDYYDHVKKIVLLPEKNPKNYKKEPGKYEDVENVFYHAFSYLRINSPAAMGELERQAAEYKLFRSLSLFFIIDIILVVLDMLFNVIPGSFTFWRLGLSVFLSGLSFYRFDFLFDWTYRLAFDFFLQIQKAGSSGKTET